MTTPFYRVVSPVYVHRQYRVRDRLRLPWVYAGDFNGPGHVEGGYCLDRPDTRPAYAYESGYCNPRPASDYLGL